MSDTFKGICFGLHSGGHPCVVVPRGAGIDVQIDERHLATLPYRACRISLAGTDDRYLSFEAEVEDKTVRVLVPDRGIIAQIQALGAPRTVIEQLDAAVARRTRRKASKSGVWLGLAGTLAALIILGWYGLGWLEDKAVESIPVEWELELGRASATQFVEQTRICTDPQLKAAINEIGMRLVRGVGTSGYAFSVHVLDTDEINAVALPGGFIFIHRGLIQSADDSSEVAGVLAHEMQHVLLRHGLGNVVRQAGATILVSILFGDAGELQQFLAHNAAQLFSMSYSRDQETQADGEALLLLNRAKLDPAGLTRFLTRIATDDQLTAALPSWLSTHPDPTDRINALHRQSALIPTGETEPLSADWATIKNRCDPAAINPINPI